MIFAAVFLLAATPPPAPVGGERRFTGPTLVCAEAFALRLTAGESLIRRSPVEDFVLYYVEGAEGSFLIYEGNAPQPHDDEIATGLGWPSVIAIHDHRSAEAKAHGRIRGRLLVGDARPAECPAADVQR
jgi:hypothetical protein